MYNAKTNETSDIWSLGCTLIQIVTESECWGHYDATSTDEIYYLFHFFIFTALIGAFSMVSPSKCKAYCLYLLEILPLVLIASYFEVFMSPVWKRKWALKRLSVRTLVQHNLFPNFNKEFWILFFNDNRFFLGVNFTKHST